MPLPKGDVHKKKELVQDVTLHDLDVANARPQVHKKNDTFKWLDSFNHENVIQLYFSILFREVQILCL